MEDEIDIYADLPNFELGDNENIVEKNKKITEKCSDLEKQVGDLTQSLESLKKINHNLEVNLSSLLQTAKAEIARKDRMIAEIRRELDDMQFRRGNHMKSSSEMTRRSPSRRRRKPSPEERNPVQEPRVPDKTEFICGDAPPLPLNSNGDGNTVDKPRRLDCIVSTVYGERLRRKILEEQEEERKQQEQSRARTDPRCKKIGETEAQSNSKADDRLKLDSKVKLRIRGENCDKKRQSEDDIESPGSRKRLKNHEGESTYRDRSRSDKRSCSRLKISSDGKSKDPSPLETDADTKFHIVDEYSAPDGDPRNTGDDDAEDRHNRVAIRLMLLAEGIDPDAEKNKPVENGEKRIGADKRENGKRREARSRSRSKSRNRRHNLRSRSRTPDQHHRSSRRSRPRDDRARKSKDRFEKRRDSRNKDGDNLSEFSREIHELKERIEHRIDDASGNGAEKGKGSNKLKRNGEKGCKGGKSRTPDSSRSGSQERVHRSRADKHSGRSRSRERHGSRNRGHRYFKNDDIPVKHSQTEISRAEKTETVQVLPPEVSTQGTENPETRSLVSLEDGEIVDSVASSPVKVVVDPARSSVEEVVPPMFNLLDSDAPVSNIIDVRPSLPLREIGNSQEIERHEPAEKLVLPILESIQPISLVNESLNSSKDERIENIAEFIANFSTNTSELKKHEQLSKKITHNNSDHEIKHDAVGSEEHDQREIIQSASNTRFQASPEDSHVVEPLAESNDILDTNPVTCNSVDNDWCLIAIDSPIKNFEENRKNRMIAQSVQIKESQEVPETATTDDEKLVKEFNDTSETPCSDENLEEKNTKEEKVGSDKPMKPLIQPVKIISRSKPTVLKSLRSTYHKGRKEIVLSDTNSEECKIISTPHSDNSMTKCLSDESGIVSRSKEEISKPGGSEKMEESSGSQRDCEVPSVDELFGDENDSKNLAEDKEMIMAIRSDVTSRITVDDKSRNSEKSNGKNIKTRNAIPERRNSKTKESKSITGKRDSSKTSNIDENKSVVSTRNKTGFKTDDRMELDTDKCSENDDKPVKVPSKGKAEGSNSKRKKEPQRWLGGTRRKQVNLEDSLTSSIIGASPNSLSDTVDDSKKTVARDLERSNAGGNSENSIERSESQARNDDRQSPEFCNVTENEKCSTSQ